MTNIPPPRPSNDDPLEFNDPRVFKSLENDNFQFIDQDNVTFEWDTRKRAWFPFFDTSLLSQQQSAYSLPGESLEIKPVKEKKEELKRKRQEEVKTTPTPRPITAVFVTNIPLDATIEEIQQTFQKCGLLLLDASNQPRIKLYKDEDESFNGQALITYLKPESVDLAIQLLDDVPFRHGDELNMKVSKAEFKDKTKENQTGPNQPNKQMGKRQKLDKKLAWHDDTPSPSLQKIVIFKKAFHPTEIDADPTLLLDLKQDVRDECEKLGKVTNVTLYDKHPDGVLSVRFQQVESAIACVRAFNGRFFGGRKLQVSLWDGTKYDSFKSGKEDESENLQRYEEWLEGKPITKSTDNVPDTPPPELPEGAEVLPGGGIAIPPSIKQVNVGDNPWSREDDTDEVLERGDE